MDDKRIIKRFFEEYDFQDEYEILGVLFYGSSSYHTKHNNSDIDLLIVTDSINNYRGATYIDGIKVEYFEKNIYSLLEDVNYLERSSNRYLTSIFTNGEILFSKNQTLEYLREEVLSRKAKVKKRRTINCSLFQEWYSIFSTVTEEDYFFDYLYHNTLEKLRCTYHEKKGYAMIPHMKVYDLYTNRDYTKKFYCVDLPDQEFIDLYLKAMLKDINQDQFDKLIEKVSDSDIVTFQNDYSLYRRKGLEYKSTIVDSFVSKSISFMLSNHPAQSHYYWLALDRVRELYCNMNQLDDNISCFGIHYDEEFLSLFYSCLNKTEKEENINKLFHFVTKDLSINYKKYRVLEFHHKRDYKIK